MDDSDFVLFLKHPVWVELSIERILAGVDIVSPAFPKAIDKESRRHGNHRRDITPFIDIRENLGQSVHPRSRSEDVMNVFWGESTLPQSVGSPMKLAVREFASGRRSFEIMDFIDYLKAFG
jgi:hypothetical protein